MPYIRNVNIFVNIFTSATLLREHYITTCYKQRQKSKKDEGKVESRKILLKLMVLHCKKKLRDAWICFDQTFLGLGLGKLFQAKKSLVSVIPAGDGHTANLFLQSGSRKGKVIEILR